MALIQEPIADAVARSDSTVHFTATAGEENGPYRFSGYVLVRGAYRFPGTGMRVDGKAITVVFTTRVLTGDVIEIPA